MSAGKLLGTFGLLSLLSACDLRTLTANQTADMLHAAAPQFNTVADLEFAESAVPANLVTMESVWRVSPNNQAVLTELVQSYTSYAFAFLEDHAEDAELNDQPERADYYRLRAKTTYMRAREFGFHLLGLRGPVDGGVEGRVHAGLDPWKNYLARFHDRDDVPGLYWTGNAWLSYIQMSLDDPGALLDLPFALALIERARAIDPSYQHGGVHMVYGLYYTGLPRELGGRPDLARTEFEAAMAGVDRHLLIYQVMYAHTYAVQMQDRALYRRLLEEVLAAGDVFPSERLTNQVAKRRARRYLNQIDTIFPPEGT